MSRQRAAVTPKTGNFLITSPEFGYGEPIPNTYAFRGSNISPELSWSDTPAGTVAYALIVEDADANDFAHWVVYNIPTTMTFMSAGVPKKNLSTSAILQGKNSNGDIGYDGPDPPSGTHHYYFRLYALDTKLKLPAGATREQVMKAVKGHILGKADHMGVYWR
jgi:Raf kinase inhibitor-like YbhB/YbcL family protein